MKKIKITIEGINITEEKKKFFSNQTIEKNNKILWDEIETISREEFENKLNSITIFKKDEKEEFMTIKDVANLQQIYEEILENKKNGKIFKLIILDIKTGEKKEI